jgi:hypothetical protein
VVEDWKQKVDTEVAYTLDELWTKVDQIALLNQASTPDVVEYLNRFYGSLGDDFEEWCDPESEA